MTKVGDIAPAARGRFLCAVVLAAQLFAAGSRTQAQAAANASGLAPIRSYIRNSWSELTRSLSDCKTVVDPKTPGRSVVYLPAGMAETPEMAALRNKCGVHIAHLPLKITRPGELANRSLGSPGLLYLPHDYVVPGGFFNEMYGWDSYFIILGLVREGRLELARGMVENFFFEIENYGAVLNANRTYFLSRSQPPFLTSMIMVLHDAEKGSENRQWLERAYGYAVRDYEMWTRAPHLAGETGLSRYFDFGEGPAPEVGGSDYQQVAEQLVRHPEWNLEFLTAEAAQQTPKAWPRFTLQFCKEGALPRQCRELERLAFTADYYKGDRSMRESGFDISFRFGPFGARSHHFAPVCLNSLLYKAERDLAALALLLGRSQEAARWQQRAEKRKAAVDTYLWDAQRGLYFDYDTEKGRRSDYVFASTFYPLWAGMASQEQAAAVAGNLKLLERAGGLAMSNRTTGVQWDLPYGWAPIQLIAVEGLRRYGFNDAADRLSIEFLSTVVENFRRDGTIREKYNVVTRSLEADVTAGYRTNVVGFGWTNGVFLQLLEGLPVEKRKSVAVAAAAR